MGDTSDRTGTPAGPPPFTGPAALVAALAGNRLAQQAADAANRREAPGMYPDTAADDGPEAGCGGCRPCFSVVSPAAYLVDLLHFLEVGTGHDLDWFNARFQQGWNELPVTCAAVEEPIMQARIAVEVLERVLAAHHGWDRSEIYARVAALPVGGDPIATPDILARTHTAYLVELGTTRAEAAAAVAAGADAVAALATRLRLTPGDVPLLATAPDRVTVTLVEAMASLLRRQRLAGIDPLDDPDAEREALASAAAAVDRVDVQTVPARRDSLIRVATDSIPDTDPDTLADRLHLDLTGDGCHRTTRIAQAVATVQAVIQAVRLGREQFPGFVLDERIWSWLGSYGTWHAAQTVFLHPEAFALPGVRRDATPAFTTLLEQLDEDASPAAVGRHVAAYRAAMESYRTAGEWSPRLRFFTPVACAGRILLVRARGDVMDLQEQRADGTWRGLRSLAGLPAPQFLDAVGHHDRIYLFFRDPDHPERLRYTSMEPDGTPATALASVDTGTRLAADGSVVLISGEQLSVYLSFTRDDGRRVVHGMCMDRFERWRHTVPTTPLPEDITVSYGLRPLGHLDGRDYFLLSSYVQTPAQLSQRITLCETADPYGPVNDQGPFPQPRIRTTYSTIWDFDDSFVRYAVAGTVYRGDLVVVVHTGEDNTTFIRLRPPQAPDYGAGLVDVAAASMVTDGRRLYLYGYQTMTGQPGIGPAVYGIAEVDGQDVTDLGRGRLEVDPDQLEQHPVGRDAGDVRRFAARQRELYAAAAPSDFMRLILDEWYLHIPLAVADALARGGRHQEAADWLHVVFNPYLGSLADRLVHAGFTAPRTPEGDLRNTLLWLRSPFDPHAIARVRDGAYLRLTMSSYIENLLDWADRLFARDSPEAISQARDVYRLAATLLDPARSDASSCLAVLLRWERDVLRLRPGEAAVALRAAALPLRQVSAAVARNTVGHLRVVLDEGHPATEELRAVRGLVRDAVALDDQQRPVHTLEELVAARRGTVPQFAGREAVAMASALAGLGAPASRALADLAAEDDGARWWVPLLGSTGWCVPPNPLLGASKLRAAAALEKIRTCRNAAGLKRSLPVYATPIDPAAAVRQAAAGEEDPDALAAGDPPPIYRYAYLLDRARSFTTIAQQLEAALLAALQQSSQREYDLLRARQDLDVAKANLLLQQLRVTEARDSASLAVLQQSRTAFQLDHFEELLGGGLSDYEQASMELMLAAATMYAAAAVSGAITGSGGAAAAQGVAVGAQIAAAYAGFERREQEWRYQRDLAAQDLAIAAQHVLIADDQVAIVEQERTVATVQDQHARDVVSFLGERFDNLELYRWMTRTLRRIYREHLAFALSAARMAQRALSFERQEPINIVAAGYAEYWDAEREGLLAAERLLLDINKLEQHRFLTERRKRELTKTISLASVAPVEFQRLRDTGRMEFVTLLDWFDRDFVGHYLRLIKSVSLTFVALSAPYDGIHATLSNRGLSRVVTSPDAGEPVTLLRQPEGISVTVSPNGTGLFELNLRDDLLLPFENVGVETPWTLEVPHATNRMVRESLVDVLMTIRYTALEDDRYRAVVLERLGADAAGNVPTGGQTFYSLRRDFADEWYHLQNPVFATGASRVPYEVDLELGVADFPPNETGHRAIRVTVAVGGTFTGRVPVRIAFRPPGAMSAWQADGEVQDGRLTLRPTVAFPFGTVAPVGRWTVHIRNDADPAAYPELFAGSTTVGGQRRLDLGWLTDLLLVLEYRAVSRYPV